jgi:hypothetical protein
MVTQRTIVATKRVLVVLILSGCAVEEGRPPLARIDLTPSAIPENDGFETLVTLDATRSADPVDDPDGSAPLEFRWSILGDDFDFEPGSNEEDVTPELRFRGDRPATITLTVTDVDGLSATATAHVQLTVD